MKDAFSAPGKAILFGEHAVVHGQPALAIPLPQLRAYARIDRVARPLSVISAARQDSVWRWRSDAAQSDDPILRLVGLTLERLRLPTLNGEISIESEIPIAAGLGSGAAVSAALGRAVAGLAHATITDADLNQLVFAVEKLHHGTPSGIDNTVVVFERPLYFVKGKASQFIAIERPLRFLLADTGVSALTREAVAHVHDLARRRPEATAATFSRIGNIVAEARHCLRSGDAERLGKLMTANQAELCALGVSSRQLDHLTDVALRAGAWGAKLSGGGRGGNMIALVDEEAAAPVTERLLQAGAANVIAVQVGGD